MYLSATSSRKKSLSIISIDSLSIVAEELKKLKILVNKLSSHLSSHNTLNFNGYFSLKK